MWPYHPQLLATPVPRYTSFPTAADFTEAVGPAHLAEAIATATGDISLYVHIPFCEKICWYCGCNTAASNRAARLASYLDALHREIVLVASLLPASARVRRIAFGGGSPNALAPVDFLRLFDQLVLNFPLDDPLVSIELDPRALGDGWEVVIAGIGARRASLGVQTFCGRLQQAIGRIQPLCLIDKSVRRLRKAGITSLNIDLMYGLPGQTGDDLAQSLQLASDYDADRIALFGYAHVPHLIGRQKRIDASALPDQEGRFAMAQAGYRQLLDAGYTPVGFDHFALPGDPLAQAAVRRQLHRNFQGYTDDGAPVLIGLGASAISSFPTLLIQNQKNAGRYRMSLSQGRLPAERGIIRTTRDRRLGAIISELLCHGRARCDREALEIASAGLNPFIEAGLCSIEHANQLVIGRRALPYSRTIAACFDPYRQSSATRFSSAV